MSLLLSTFFKNECQYMYFKLRILLVVVISMVIISCGENESDRDFEAIEGPSVSDLIRNPATLRGDKDTTNVPILTFEREVIFFDTVYEGTIIEETFVFINTGKTPLWITDVRTTCGCTVPSYPGDPVMPGDGGEIKVRFNTANKNYLQDRPITIFANTYPGRTVLRLRGYVEPKGELHG